MTESNGTPDPTSGPDAPRPGEPVSTSVAPTPHPPVRPGAAAWGRVDPDGSVWLRTADGERLIGSWQAGDPAEALAHYHRRFEDLATEVTLLESRLASGAGDARRTKTVAQTLLESLDTAAVIGDLEALRRRLTEISEHSDEAAAQARQEKDRQRREQTARKEALAAEAEQLATESTQWKSAGDRLREILDEWKTIRGVDRKTDDVLWKRYAKAREAFNRRRGAHFAELDRGRAAAKTHKEQLCVRAEELSGSTDWTSTAAAYRDLLVEWKESGRAPRDADDALWRRFKAAQDVFFAARNTASSERDAELEHNAVAKDELLRQAERSIDPAADLDGARAALRELLNRWDEIGKVPRERLQPLESRLRAVERRVRDKVDSQWRRSDPEAVARAAQFRERVVQFEAQAAKAQAAGRDRDAAKALEQAAQWREWAAAAEGAVSDR